MALRADESESCAQLCILDALDASLLRHIVSEFCDVATAMLLCSTCRQLRAMQADESLWRRVASRVYGDELWLAAAARPAESARPLASRLQELRRMACFEARHQRAFNRAFCAKDYVALWRWRDQRVALEGLLPWLCPPLRERESRQRDVHLPRAMERVKRALGTYKPLGEGADEAEGVPLVDMSGGSVEVQQHGAAPGAGTASAFSRMLFLWVGPMLKLGRSRQLELDDLFELPVDSGTTRLAANFGAHLAEEVAKGARETEEWGDLPPPGRSSPLRQLPPVFWALKRQFGPAFVRAGLFKLGSDTLQFLPAVVLADYLQALSGRHTHVLARMGATSPAGCAAAYAIMLFVFPLARTLVEQAYFYRVQLINMGVRASLQTAVYNKSVALSNASKASSSSGEILNLMQLDASRISELVTYLHVTWSAAVQTIGYVTLLYTYIGWSVLGGLTAMFALIPLQSRVFRIIAAKRKTQLALTDKRVKMQNEALSGIKIIKLNAWEAPMLASISAVRAEELAVARNLAYINAFVSCLITTLPTLVAVSAFTLYSAVMKREMAAWIIFPALSLFNQLRFPIMFLPRVLSMCADALVSLKRLQRYIALVESESAAPRMPWPADAAAAAARAPGASSEVLASISGGSFHFAPLQRGESPFLRDVTLELRRGALTLVVGQVGSGKSTLAAALLGEMALCSAATTAPRVNGRVAYVAQSAWVQSITLKENVLFGLPFDQARYEAAVAAACLGPDVALLPNGHDTEIGERGITLSGGQRARVAIARAVYADADVYILDDPLSALDAHVGRAVFNECIRGVLRDKAVLLITHALAYCADADTVLVMDAGRIAEAGPYPTLMAARSKFATLMAEYGSVGAAEEEAEEPSVATLQASGEAAPAAAAAAPAKAAAAPGAGAKMIEAEKREEGSVKWSVFSSYAAAFPGGWHTISVLLLLNVVKQLAAIGSTLWLAVWSGTKLGPSWHDAGYLTVYALFSIAVALVTYLKSVAWTYCGIEAAGALHARLLHAALSVRLTWFDVTPLGRILQRFSKDTDTCDNSLPASWNSTTEFLTGLASVIVTICVIEPTVIPLFLPIGWLYFRVQAYFRASYREIKRLDGVSGSPIYAHFSETLAGLATIRAFGHQARFLGANLARVGANQRAFYAQRCACDRWLPVRLETVGNLIVLAVALLGVPYAGTAYAPFVGLVLSFSLDLTGLLSWVIRQWSETEAGMVSVERVAEYASLPTEEDSVPAERGAREPAPPAWPRAGALRLEALSLRYQPAMPLVLRAVSADIAAGEKVGVVGRTGSGKSTLLVALWRLVEPEPGGRVWLDGVDTSRLPLEQLRGALTCIPQEPVLFSGTMRHNLHPIGAHDGAAAVTDAALWDALDAVGMKRAISATGLGLDAQCAEFGASFSAGERQLLSLARALLRNTKVVCLDEATASVDLESDARMQAVIAQRFAACTVVVIAHRLHTIISSSRIMCMAAGELVAMGSPAALLADPASVFSALVAETGEEALLRAKAAAAAAPSV